MTKKEVAEFFSSERAQEVLKFMVNYFGYFDFPSTGIEPQSLAFKAGRMSVLNEMLKWSNIEFAKIIEIQGTMLKEIAREDAISKTQTEYERMLRMAGGK